VRPQALARACGLLDECPAAGVVAGRTLVGPERAEDPLNDVMAGSPLPRDHLPGPRMLGFLGCAIVARREAFLAARGYRRLLGIGGEEELLALDLAARGWASVYAPRLWLGGEEELLAAGLIGAGHVLCYLPDAVVHHQPSTARDPRRRRLLGIRNTLWFTWLRRPLPAAAGRTWKLARTVPRDATSARR
jgi:hypothetical protein